MDFVPCDSKSRFGKHYARSKKGQKYGNIVDGKWTVLHLERNKPLYGEG
jgi:hypothetical protein